MEKVTNPDDPLRCQGVGSAGQCWHKSVPGTSKCERHGGTTAAKSLARKKSHDYDIQMWQARIDHFADSDAVKRLDGEVALCRMALENLVKSCDTANALIVNNAAIQSTANNIRALIETMQRLEERNSLLLNRTQVQAFSQRVLQIVMRYIDDPEDREAIAQEISNVSVEEGDDLDIDKRLGTVKSF